MAITPSSDLKLLQCNIELDNKNQLTFSNATAQYNYFNSLPKIEATGYTYLRKDNVIRYNAHIDTLINYNYIMYRNTNYSNKWFYAFITKMEYVSDNVTFIYIETDYYQTWQFDLNFKKCFVEREHVSNDTIGAHLIDEGLEIGDYVINGDPVNEPWLQKNIIAIVASQHTDGGVTSPCYRGKLVDGLIYHLFNVFATDPTHQQNARDELGRIFGLYTQHRPEAIIAIASMPAVCWPSYNEATSEYRIETSLSAPNYNWDLTRNTTINGYSPKNNKLFTGNYNFLMIDNNSGAMAKYNYEYFSNPSAPSFRVRVAPSIGSSVSIVPFEYKGTSSEANKNESLAGGKYATCAWAGDAYTSWLNQNSLNVGVGYFTSIAEVGVGAIAIATGIGSVAGAGLIASGAGGILNQIQQQHNASYLPPQADTNTSNADVPNTFGYNTFTAYRMSITSERAKIIDDYFTMFGYKVNTLKVPALHSRSKWNYVKTIDINVTGDIPQEDIQKIKDMFNSGVTLWHDSAHFLDYSQTNSII